MRAKKNFIPKTDYTKFRIGPDDLVTVHGRKLRFVKNYLDKGIILRGIEGNRDVVTQVMQWPMISQLHAEGKLEIAVGYFSERAAIERAGSTKAFELPPETTLRAVMVSHFLQQEAERDEASFGYFRSDKDIRQFMATFAVENVALVEEAQRSLAAKGKSKVFVGPRQFRRLIARFEDCELDPVSLASRNAGGNRIGSTFTQEELSFQLQFAEEYRSLDRPTVKHCWLKMRRAHEERLKKGLAPLRLPSLTTFQRLVREGNDFHNEAGRSGNKHRIQRKYDFKKQGLQTTRNLQMLEMDDKEMDLVVTFTKNGLWETFHKDAQKRIKELGRVNICVAIDAHSRSVLGMKIIPGAPSSSSAIATLAMVAQNKDHIAAQVGATSKWPQCGRPEAVHTDAGAPYVSAQFEMTVLMFSGRHRIPPSKHPHLRGRVERFFRTINQRYTHMFSAQTFSNPLAKDEYDSEKYVHLTDGEFADLLVRLIVDCYHNTKHRALGMTPLEAWYRSSQLADGGVAPPPNERAYREIFGTTLVRAIGNNGIEIAGNIYSSPKLLEIRKKWFRANLIVRMNDQDISKISVKHKSLNKWIEVPAVFDGLKGVTLQEWKETIRFIETRFGTRKTHSEETVAEAIKVTQETIAASKRRDGVLIHKPTDQWVAEIEAGMAPGFGYSQNPLYDYGQYDDFVDDFEDPTTAWLADVGVDSEAVERTVAEGPAGPVSKDVSLPDGDFDRSGFISSSERLAKPGADAKKTAGKPNSSVAKSKTVMPQSDTPAIDHRAEQRPAKTISIGKKTGKDAE